ncbi:hypothetical protein OSCT_1710 [Oscillochloris trichoides DG-6]|uniref:HDIG domain-containing protein n=1 Tax=Oscillochloris trichoides DG-6 TaxID=765420 RepID=E1IEF9_9CHLR|nr:hypothetical protein [Oscillochloris trichoides]EFO80485.1 hypothetical protein OSCT_1710 [Oscillochloris trichoides DG-6]
MADESLAYRVRQFTAALHALVSDEERHLVAALLSPSEQRLFNQMPTYDQRHCLDVYYTLVAANHTDPILLRGAIIHDCGKVDDDGRPMGLLWYVAATIIKRLPALYLALAKEGYGPLRPLRVYAEHAWRGAHMAAQAGAPAEMVMMLRHYHDPAPQGRAALLQWADEQH